MPRAAGPQAALDICLQLDIDLGCLRKHQKFAEAGKSSLVEHEANASVEQSVQAEGIRIFGAANGDSCLPSVFVNPLDLESDLLTAAARDVSGRRGNRRKLVAGRGGHRII